MLMLAGFWRKLAAPASSLAGGNGVAGGWLCRRWPGYLSSLMAGCGWRNGNGWQLWRVSAAAYTALFNGSRLAASASQPWLQCGCSAMCIVCQCNREAHSGSMTLATGVYIQYDSIIHL